MMTQIFFPAGHTGNKAAAMNDFSYQADIFRYVSPGQIPLYVENVREGTHPEHLRHDHKFLEIVLVYAGSAKHCLGNQTCSIRRGDLLVIHPGVIHCYENTESLALVNVACDYRRLAMPILDGYAMPLFQRLFPQKQQFSESEQCRPVANLNDISLTAALEQIERLRAGLASEQRGKYFASLAAFMEFTMELAREVNWNSDRRISYFPLDEVVCYINRSLSKTISVGDLSRHAKMSQRNFFRSFKQFAGCAPMMFVENLRVRQATELLQTSQRSLEDIARSCGFCDANYMSRVFRKKKIDSPYKLRHAASAKQSRTR